MGDCYTVGFDKSKIFPVTIEPEVRMQHIQIVDSVFAPILKQLADEGSLLGWGQFNHAWGDEWNVNFWYVTKDANSFHSFWDEYMKRVREQHPESWKIVEYFQAHKDNMYVIRNQYSPSGD